MRCFIYDGVRYLLNSHTEEAIGEFHKQLPAIKADIAGMKASQTGAQKWFNRENKWKITERFGIVTVKIYTEMPVEAGVTKEEVVDLTVDYPVLGILLNAIGDKYTPAADIHPSSIDPKKDGSNWLRVQAVKAVVGDAGYEVGAYPYSVVEGTRFSWPQGEHNRLKHVGQDDTQGDITTNTVTYTQAAPNILFLDEMAYRTIWDSFGNSYNVDPILFTCGDYVPVTELEIELYGGDSTIRATERHTVETYNISLNTDGTKIISPAVFDNNYQYEITFLRDYVIPDDLYADDWSAERIARCCIPSGTYQLYSKDVGETVYSGQQAYWEYGEGTQEISGFTLDGFSSCLFSRYTYSGIPDDVEYGYELVLYADNPDGTTGEEYPVYSGQSTPDFMPDDIYVNDFKIYNFQGSPVVVFAYFHFFAETGNIAQYGIWWNKKLYLSDEYPLLTGNVHDIKGYGASDGLEASGFVTAWGIMTKQSMLIL